MSEQVKACGQKDQHRRRNRKKSRSIPGGLSTGCLKHVGALLHRLIVARHFWYLLAHWNDLFAAGSHRHHPANLVGDILADVRGNILALGGEDRLADFLGDGLANLVRNLGK